MTGRMDGEGGESAMATDDRLEAGKLEPLTDRVQVVAEAGTGTSNRLMRMLSLMLLTPQYAVLILLMRYVRTRPGRPMFLTSTTVLLSEVLKTLSCLLLILGQVGGSPRAWAAHLHEHLLSRPRDFLKVCLPSLLFVLQNNLVFVAISNLDAATFQVTYQLKILTTAVFSVLLLKKRLSATQWVSLMMLFAGVSLIQVKLAMAQVALSRSKSTLSLEKMPDQAKTSSSSSSSENAISATAERTVGRGEGGGRGGGVGVADTPEQNHFTGLLAVLACCCLSGFANVFFELLLKGGKQSVWIRNVQLGSSGAVLGALTCLLHDGPQLIDQGFFYGYDGLVWTVIVLQSVGGLLVAAVIKYADNILKGFSTAGSILLSCLASVYIFDFQMDSIFMLGTSLVLLSLFLYNQYPAVQPDRDAKEVTVQAVVSNGSVTQK
ncbi:UDP-N-acetylglucosamine transporter-like [Babylonia areolata]|uniref:UDP-N-acetylglucosamine transporter-like n=1 Tax=Babylonia areolata TaxID=304850 RepID=UPI003FCF1B9B